MGKLNYLSQNEKMRKSSYHYDIYNWGIPAFISKISKIKTCPNAGQCATGCYAQSGTYRFKNVVSKYESRLQLALSEQFQDVIASEIETAKTKASKRDKQCVIRIHDSGDFFSDQYVDKWLEVIQSQPDTLFYAYTKEVSRFKSMELPKNLIMIYSYGGKQDHLIDPEQDRHSRVFQDETSLIEAGYADASHDDTVAFGENLKIGLVYHGSKKYANTHWDRVNVPE